MCINFGSSNENPGLEDRNKKEGLTENVSITIFSKRILDYNPFFRAYTKNGILFVYL
ncbi:hypothetical protein CWI37_0017p0010 [Hamiltosporidium tvaerminnensis]|uniref:Uncharacterized protein n=2 Tax=Hamiltosporidium TaxID=1176354 RepID=A0A4Q9LJB5_9MICR|nr:hypothetical protein CWI37_0017p0010 [Hamiltosporidium tvaerminnensis]TBU08298.1 hypothetical protein CWI39_0200p0010 [Hamiltosporidium magnivora]